MMFLKMKKNTTLTMLLACFLLMFAQMSLANESKEADKAHHIGKIQITAEESKEDVILLPLKTLVDVENYSAPGVPQNITDIIKDQAIIDLRGQSDLVPEPDTIFMRGFNSRSYVTAIDGMQFQKSGGYWGTHFVDYSLIPLSQIETIEIIPGPHSPLYTGQAVGGVINVKIKEPKQHKKAEINGSVATSYKSYNTFDTKINVEGGKDNFDFGIAYQNYSTDGYLKNNHAKIESFSGRFGYILPSGGHISAMGSLAWKDTGWIVRNDPSQPDYDPGYPDVIPTSTTAAQSPWREKEPQYFNIKYKQPTPIGLWDFTAYYYYDDQKNYAKEKSGRFRNGWPAGVINWHTYGIKIQDEIELFEGNTLIVGYEVAHLESDRQNKSGFNDLFIQDKWELTEALSLTLGARYENIDIYWSNWSSSKGYKDKSIQKKYIKKSYSSISPKSFLTYELDKLAAGLRDTSLSLGVSRLWSPRSGYCQV
ncbi:MAG: TonB-dependent receptor [Desulfobacteraceae bacterium]|nr:TonB-dependent receptor [Desulfobacteraceae bacterium]